jgi:hypothetical protein
VLHDAFDEASKPEYYYEVSGKMCAERAARLTETKTDDRWQITCPVMKPSELRTWLVRLHWATQDVVRQLVEMGYSDKEYYENSDAGRAGTRVNPNWPARNCS